MKYEIKQINDTDAVVISDGKIKENTNTFKEGINGDWFWCSKYNKIARTGDITSFDFKIIATLSPFKIEGLPMLELPNQEEDVRRLALKMYPVAEAVRNITFDDGVIERREIEDVNEDLRDGFIAGYKAAQNKKFKT